MLRGCSLTQMVVGKVLRVVREMYLSVLFKLNVSRLMKRGKYVYVFPEKFRLVGYSLKYS